MYGNEKVKKRRGEINKISQRKGEKKEGSKKSTREKTCLLVKKYIRKTVKWGYNVGVVLSKNHY